MSKEFLHIHAAIECEFTLKWVRDIKRTCSQMYCTGKYSQVSSIIWSLWPNSWLFIYELSVCGSESSCSHLSFRFRACLTQEIPWHSGKYTMWIHSETPTWHDKNIQLNAPYRQVLTFQLNHLVSLAKWLSVPLRTKWLHVRVQLQFLKLQISRLFQSRRSLTFRQLYSAYSLWNTYVTWQEHTVKCTVQIRTHNSAQSFGQFGQTVECSFTN